MKHWFKEQAIHIAFIGLFLMISFIYFSPIFNGKSLVQGDVFRAEAGQTEIMHFLKAEGKAPLWTNAMFGGMPSYQIWVSFPKNITTHIIYGVKALFPSPVDIIFIFLAGAYLLFCTLKINPWLAVLGAIAITFSSYNFIYIEAGHSNQAYALAFFAPLLAGILLTLNGKFLWGSALTMFFLALEIRVNHIQVTYYFFIAIMLLILIELYKATKAKQFKHIIKSLGCLVVSAIIAIAINAGLLWTTYEYSQETIRGEANLKMEGAQESQKGVDRDYAYKWSQGVAENITFLIPNAYGGGNVGNLDGNSNVAKWLTSHGVSEAEAITFVNGLQTYWGEKPFTHGPWYFGAIIIFFMVLGLFIVHGKLKWWILMATLLSIFLSFGRHLSLVSDLFFDYVPLYNKFRAVESNLVVAALLIPILAILAIQKLIQEKNVILNINKKLSYSFYIVGGVCLIVWLLPNLFLDFRGSGDQLLRERLTQQIGNDGNMVAEIMNELIKDRIALAKTDAFRSLLFVGFCFLGVWLFLKDKLNARNLIVSLIVLVTIDMWSIDKRFLNNDNFTDEINLKQIANAQASQVDNEILQDKEKDYRVLDLRSNPFTNASTSYFHKSLGGYHAAKLMRYQELIDHQFAKGINTSVLDMLNCKYTINMDDHGTQHNLRNTTAIGSAWFVDSVRIVENNEEEMKALSNFTPKSEAIIHKEFKQSIGSIDKSTATNAKIELTAYRPDYLIYQYRIEKSKVAVFSEIWYDKGWEAYVDGEKIPHFRANYLLRAAKLPAGNHKVEFIFKPRSYFIGETISMIASILLVGIFMVTIWFSRKDWFNSNHAEV